MKKFAIPCLLILFLVSVIAIWLGVGRENVFKRDFDDMVNSGEIRIITGYNSLGYHISGDSTSGFNKELLTLLEQYSPVKFDLVVVNLVDDQINGLMTGLYDIVASNIPVTSKLRDSLSFTDPITHNKLVLVQRKQEFNSDIPPIRSHLDLAKKKLFIPKNSPAILRLQNLSHEIGDTIYYVEDPIYNGEQLAMKVAAGEIEYAVCDLQNMRRIASKLPEIDFETNVGFTQIEAWAVRQNSPILLDSLNSWLEKVKHTKEYESLLRKYYD